jgi:hypothetical protein
MRDRLRALIQQGLFAENLETIAEYADQLVPAMPAIFLPLGWIARSLVDEYSRQATTGARYNAVKRELTQPLLDLLDAEEAPADKFLGKLNETLRVYHRLMLDGTT